MSDRTFDGFGEFAARGVPWMQKAVKVALAELHSEIHNQLYPALVAGTPVQAGPKGGDMKAAWRARPSQRVRLPPTSSNVTEIINDNPAAGIIALGRRSSKSAGHLLGSTQAPRGVGQPQIKKVKRLAKRLEQRAVVKAQRT